VNEIVKTPQRAPLVVGSLELPPISRTLRDLLREAEDPHPDVGLSPVPAFVRTEAEAQLRALDLAGRIAERQDWRRFLLPLAIMPKAPKVRGRADDPSKPDGLDEACGTIAFALHLVPARMLTVDLQRQIMRDPGHPWFPDAPRLQSLLGPKMWSLAQHRRHLEIVIAQREARGRVVQMSDEQRAEMGGQFGDLVGEMRKRAEQRQREERAAATKAIDPMREERHANAVRTVKRFEGRAPEDVTPYELRMAIAADQGNREAILYWQDRDQKAQRARMRRMAEEDRERAARAQDGRDGNA
jgi:hypothetical protein